MDSDTNTSLTPYEQLVKRNIEENRRVLKSLGLLNPVIERKENITKAPRKAHVAVKKRTSFKQDDESPALPARRTRRSTSLLKAHGYDEFDDVSIIADEENTPPHKRKKIVPEPVFGPIEGVSVGDWWLTRLECSAAGVHRPTIAGIHGKLGEGCYSIALSGGYEDDIDYGEYFTYTGSGGRDLKGTKSNPKNLRTAPQTKDQVMEGPNAALALNIENHRPVRVIRGYKLPSPYAPEEGYRYDGLYSVERCWTATGLAGFKVFKYALKRLSDQDPPPWVVNGSDISTHNGSGNGSDIPTHNGSSNGSDIPTHDGSGNGSDIPTHNGSSNGSDIPTHDGSGNGSDIPTHNGSSNGSDIPTHDGSSNRLDISTLNGSGNGSDILTHNGSGNRSDIRPSESAEEMPKREEIGLLKEDSSEDQHTSDSTDSPKECLTSPSESSLKVVQDIERENVSKIKNNSDMPLKRKRKSSELLVKPEDTKDEPLSTDSLNTQQELLLKYELDSFMTVEMRPKRKRLSNSVNLEKKGPTEDSLNSIQNSSNSNNCFVKETQITPKRKRISSNANNDIEVVSDTNKAIESSGVSVESKEKGNSRPLTYMLNSTKSILDNNGVSGKGENARKRRKLSSSPKPVNNYTKHNQKPTSHSPGSHNVSDNNKSEELTYMSTTTMKTLNARKTNTEDSKRNSEITSLDTLNTVHIGLEDDVAEEALEATLKGNEETSIVKSLSIVSAMEPNPISINKKEINGKNGPSAKDGFTNKDGSHNQQKSHDSVNKIMLNKEQSEIKKHKVSPSTNISRSKNENDGLNFTESSPIRSCEVRLYNLLNKVPSEIKKQKVSPCTNTNQSKNENDVLNFTESSPISSCEVRLYNLSPEDVENYCAKLKSPENGKNQKENTNKSPYSSEKKVTFSPEVVFNYIIGKKCTVKNLPLSDSESKSSARRLYYQGKLNVSDEPQCECETKLEVFENSNGDMKEQMSILKYFKPVQKEVKQVSSRGMPLRSNRRSIITSDGLPVLESKTKVCNKMSVKNGAQQEMEDIAVVESANTSDQKQASLSPASSPETTCSISEKVGETEEERVRNLSFQNINEAEEFCRGWDWDVDDIDFLGFDFDEELYFLGFDDDPELLKNLELMKSVINKIANDV